MSAALDAHFYSLVNSEKSEPIKGSDLRKPGVYQRLIEERKAKNQPIPPAEHIERSGHHWLIHKPPFNGPIRYMVAQWAPGELQWYRSDEVSTMCKPINLEYWEWLAEVPLPDL